MELPLDNVLPVKNRTPDQLHELLRLFRSRCQAIASFEMRLELETLV
jgi:hypothetical protein